MVKRRFNLQDICFSINACTSHMSRRCKQKRRVHQMEYLPHISIFDASVHILRHTTAAYYIAQGTTIQVIQETLGISLEARERKISRYQRRRRARPCKSMRYRRGNERPAGGTDELSASFH